MNRLSPNHVALFALPALALFAALFAASFAACAPIGGDSAEPSASSHEPPALVSGSYAAMNEAPVQGGELRLEKPIEIEVDVELDVAVDVEAAGEGDGEGNVEGEDLVDGNDDLAPTDRVARRQVTTAMAIAFPLKHTDVAVEVSGMIAHYTVTQTFENPYLEPLEAVYVFPLGDKSAVVDYEIVIGDRTVKGVIETRQKAREIYQRAKEAGNTAALLEQEKPNIFTQHVANIAPREQIKVRFRYIEMLDYRDNTYELAYPMVVGPRYLPADHVGPNPVASHRAGQPARPGVRSVPVVAAEVAANTVSFRASIDAGVPIVSATSPSHEIVVGSPSETEREITLAGGANIPNRDLVLRYSAAGRQTMVGMMTHRSDADGFFSLVVQPKAAYRQSDVQPREVVILIDRSGSMSGAPLGQARALASAIVDTLGERDVFNVITFAAGTDHMASDPIAGSATGKTRGKAWIASVNSGGGTEMESGILTSLATVPGNDRVRMIYVLSDGFVGNDEVILGAAQKYLGHNRIYPIGIGSAPNRYLFDRLGEVGKGFTSYLLPSEDASELATDLVRRSAHPYLTDVAIDWAGLEVTGISPAKIPDVHAGIPIVISGRYTRPGQGTIVVKARGSRGAVEIPIAVALPNAIERPGVRYLWARHRIDELMARDFGSTSAGVEREVTELGLEFGMVTSFTSFVAVDRSRVVRGGKVQTVMQPVAIPAGVDINTAVAPAPPPPRSSSRRSSGGWGGGGGGGGGGWGGGDTDPFTILFVLLLVPAILVLRRLRTE